MNYHLNIYKQDIVEFASISVLILKEYLLNLECMTQWTKDRNDSALTFEAVVSPPHSSPARMAHGSTQHTPIRVSSHPTSLVQSPNPGVGVPHIHRSCIFDEISLQDTLVIRSPRDTKRRYTSLNTSLLRWNRVLIPKLNILMLVVGTR